MSIVWYSIRRSIFNLRMLLVIAVSVGFLYFELFYGQVFWGIKEEYGSALLLFANVVALSPYIIFTGLFPGMPYAFSLLEERNSGYIQYIFQRMSVREYILLKMFCVGVSGALSMGIPYILLILPIKMRLPNHPQKFIDNMPGGLIWGEIANIWDGNLFFMLRGILFVLFGILWSEIALLISLFIKNRYIAFAAPFMLFQLLWIVFPGMLINPVYLIRSDFNISEASIWFPYLIFVFYILGVVIAIYFVFRKQVKHG